MSGEVRVYSKSGGVVELLSVGNKLLFIKQDTIYDRVNIDDITCIESDNVYIHIHLIDNEISG